MSVLTEHQDACQVDIPMFSTSPPAIYAADFKPQASYVFDIEFRNQDKSPRSYHLQSDRSATLSIEDGAFTIEPSHGEVMFGTRREIRIIFSPAYARAHSALALCDIEGRQQALPLILAGQGEGPLVKFSFRSLDVGQVFISARHTYELVVANACEIDAIFSVKPLSSSAFSDCFSFSHDEGLISPQDYQAVDITFCSPDRLGKFNESFEFLFDGSPNPEIITIRGEVVGPTLFFKTEELDFGLVSYGFSVTKVLKLCNNSTVPVNFKLRTVEDDEMDEDSRHADRSGGSEDDDSGCALNSERLTATAILKNIEFDVKPCCGHMDALSSMEMEITFKPMIAGRLKWKLIVDAEHVTGATYLPVSAECRVPHVTIESCDLNIGLCFLNYPKPFLVRLKNHDEDLQAHYSFLSSNAESGQEVEGLSFHSKNPKGVLPAATSTNILVDAIVSSRGYFSQKVFFSILGSEDPPLAALITCHGEGPVINVADDIIDWDKVPTLTPSPRSLLVANETPIMARISVIIHQEIKAFEASPTEFELAPFAQCTLTITAEVNDTIRFTGILELLVEEASSSHKVELRAFGKGTTIVFEPTLPATLNLGQHFDTTPLRRAFRVRNRGRRLQRLIWSIEDLHVHSKTNKHSNEEAVNNAASALEITILPNRFELAPGKSTELIIEAKARCPQVAVCCIKCHTIIDRRGAKELIKKVTYSAEFIAPELETVPESLLFHIEKELALCTAEAKLIRVDFDPNFKEDPVSRCIEDNLIIEFLEHPSIQHVPLRGEVLFPNLKLQTDLVDFGCILNHSESAQVVTLMNISPLDVHYRWSFIIGDCPHLAFKRDSETPLISSAPSWLTKNHTLSAAPRLQSVADTSPDMQVDATPNLKRARVSLVPGAVPSLHSDPAIETNRGVDSLITLRKPIAHLGIEEVLDITPLCGVIKPGEAQPAVFSFFGHPNITVDVCANCEVEGGPSYQVKVKGESSEIDYSVDRWELNFGAIIYKQEAVECLNIFNQGKISCEFQLEIAELSDPCFKVEVSPMSGFLAAGLTQEVQVRVIASRPEPFRGALSLVVAKTVPRRIGIQGSAEFPHLLLSLPRLIESSQNQEIEPPEVKRACGYVFTEHEKRLVQLSNDLETKLDDCVGEGFQKNYQDLLDAERRFISILEIYKGSPIYHSRENSYYKNLRRNTAAKLRRVTMLFNFFC
ncbi:unnamed protein product [Schistocephalus solidus]|uniref:ASH domain-containing protein n=1 Tax=Schistocephalus solidus TaxID=70667 RepID=A0A183SIC4_SCHSO|nr:unnamed protein product [Schistocephalus solidus]